MLRDSTIPEFCERRHWSRSFFSARRFRKPAYSLRHSSIVRQLLGHVPRRVCAAHHDTSAVMIERVYSAHIGDHADALTRAALLDASFKSTPPLPIVQPRASRGFQCLRPPFNRTLVQTYINYIKSGLYSVFEVQPIIETVWGLLPTTGVALRAALDFLQSDRRAVHGRGEVHA